MEYMQLPNAFPDVMNCPIPLVLRSVYCRNYAAKIRQHSWHKLVFCSCDVDIVTEPAEYCDGDRIRDDKMTGIIK
jgi:hypothetical protein